MRFTIPAFVLMSVACHADEPKLNFDPAKLCQWQSTNNSMNIDECMKLETDGKQAVAAMETTADKERVAECRTEALNFSGDSGFASYTVYAACLKDGPGSL